MRVSFDSNAWEPVFDPAEQAYTPILDALVSGALKGFICDAGFRIEAIRKPDRSAYFAKSHLDVRWDGIVQRDGQSFVKLSMGPVDERHPGLHPTQSARLQRALGAGVKLMRGQSWMGLPAASELRDPALFILESPAAQRDREQLQLDVSTEIDARGVGHAAFLAADGWSAAGRPPADLPRFRKACAEWADGELVAAHIAYGHDVLCTNDRAQGAGTSVFDAANRAWLTATYGVVFKTVPELLADLAS